jgi:hypothetical protein
MALTLPSTPEVQIARLTEAIYGAAPGYTYMTAFKAEVENTSMTAFANWLAGTLSSNTADLTAAVVANLGLTGQAATDGTNYLNAQFAANAGNAGKVILDAMNTLSTMTADPNFGAAATNFNNHVANSYVFSTNAANTTMDLVVLQAADESVSTGVTFALTTGIDAVAGGANDDTFTARIFDNANTLQSGDVINGGAGNDTLTADIGDSQNFAITAETQSVETVKIRAEAMSWDSTDNNMSATNEVQIDAQRMVGVTTWEDSNSRADVVIEDVRILDNQITKDITIAMVETDPGHVDYGVYFDQYSLRSMTNSNSQVNLQVIDTRSAVLGTGPLLNNPYDGIDFYVDGILVSLRSQAIDDAQTYAALRDAFAAAVVDAGLGGAVTVTIGNTFQVSDPTTGQLVEGSEIVLSASGAHVITTGAGTGWHASGVVPPNSGLHTNLTFGSSSATAPVTSTVILDDVGRGSTGGDLVIGGLSVGDTSHSRGVERFEIEVRDNSKLQTINSTNNTLKEVSIVNGVTTSHVITPAHPGVATAQNAGNLTVNGTVGNPAAGIGINEALPGSATQHDGGFGFSDVRLIDGSAMTGKLAFTAELTNAAIGKYVDLVDTATNPAADNIAVHYSGGANNDTMVVAIDGSVAGSHSNINSGREDFTFTFDGNAGNDNITVEVVNSPTVVGGTQAWYNNQKLNANITINGGAGDDTINKPGAGDAKINGGDGNDAIYADNTGNAALVSNSPAADLSIAAPRAIWVLNTADQLGLAGASEARSLADLNSSANTLHALYQADVTVTYKGLTATHQIGGMADYVTSDLQINNAIKAAINTDAVLSKLLIATDGPANTLEVHSLIDGLQLVGDFGVAITAPTAAEITATQLAALRTAWTAAGFVDPVTAAQAVIDMGVDLAATVAGDYSANFAETGNTGVVANTDMAGANSVTTSDNHINGGAGNDVIVLGTTVGLDAAASIDDSNDVVVYDAAFGNDTVVHFINGTMDASAAGLDGFGLAGRDMFDFTALGGDGAAFSAAIAATQHGIIVEATAAGNDTVAEITALFNGLASAVAGHQYVYINYDAQNVGHVYTVTDGSGAADCVVTLVGTIDLADTAWAGVTATNFVTM